MAESCWKAGDPVEVLPFLNAKERNALEKAGLVKVQDLLNSLPKRYEDRRRFDAFPAGATTRAVCLRGKVIDAKQRGFGGRGFFEATVQDGGASVFSTNNVSCRWFNMPFMSRVIASGQDVILYGKPKEYQGRLVIDHPEIEVVSAAGEDLIHLERIVPVYKNVTGINQRKLREIQYWTLEGLVSDDDSVEFSSGRLQEDLWRQVHFPKSEEDAADARREFAREEFVELQLEVLRRRQDADEDPGLSQGNKTALLTEFYQSLPFDLTGAQKRTVKEIVKDMRKPRPMSRLLQGDVGSGKTLVALCSMLLAVESGNQAALMAPTQILAEQHYETFKRWLEPLGIRLALVTGARDERSNLEMAGEPQIVIGTHALLYDRVEFSSLGLVVIDEQHKFGVLQRDKLIAQGAMPDVLVMTATPIPRTLTLTLYGDLDVSVLDERPANRGKIVTGVRVNPKVKDVTQFLKSQLEEDRQVYLVYPLVEESEKVKAASAVTEFEKWQKRFRHFEVGLLHGKLSPEEKDSVMESFRQNRTQVLVATTVIEVGVDVPNANVMVIYGADRFGLAQLHQLRGRIGRGEHKSFCVLVTDGKNPDGLAKLEVLASTDDGFVIAEEDLKLRGPGEVMGTRQSGLADLRFVEYLGDVALIREAREIAEERLLSGGR